MKPKAFTFIEVLGILAVVAIMAALVIPKIMEKKPPRTTLTVEKQSIRIAHIGGVELTLTNVISMTEHEPNCYLIRYVSGPHTNEFHAWMVPVMIETLYQ